MADLEIIVCLAFDHRASGAELAEFKARISRCPFVDTTMEVSGTYDFIVQGHCASHAEYADHMEPIRPQIAQLVTRIEVNFISSKIDQHHDDDSAIWLPCDGGRKRVETKSIDKILAEGDYMRVHVGSWNCLLGIVRANAPTCKEARIGALPCLALSSQPVRSATLRPRLR